VGDASAGADALFYALTAGNPMPVASAPYEYGYALHGDACSGMGWRHVAMRQLPIPDGVADVRANDEDHIDINNFPWTWHAEEHYRISTAISVIASRADRVFNHMVLAGAPATAAARGYVAGMLAAPQRVFDIPAAGKIFRGEETGTMELYYDSLPPDFLQVPWPPSPDLWFYNAVNAETLTINGDPVPVPDLYATVWGMEDMDFVSNDGLWTLTRANNIWTLAHSGGAKWAGQEYEDPTITAFTASSGGAGGTCGFNANLHPHEVIQLPGGLVVRTSYDYGTSRNVIETSQDGGATWAEWPDATLALANNNPGWGYGQAVPVNNHIGPDERHYAFLVNSNEAYLAIAEIPEA
jgi:hypothetical protein